MRLLVVGLVLVAVAIGLSQYTLRNPPEVKKDPATTAAAASAPVAPPAPDGKHLSEAVTFQDADRPALEALQAAVEKSAARSSAGGWATVFKANVTVGSLTAGKGRAVFAYGSEVNGLVEVTAKEKARALVATKEVVTAFAVADSVAWAEGSRVFKMNGDGAVVPWVAFSHARVTSMTWTSADSVAVALMPKEADPMSTEPDAVVSVIDASGKVLPLVAGQIRPRALIAVERDVFFVSGFPPSLSRAANDGSFSGKISESAEGPLVFDGEGILFRYPVSSGPEVRRVARSGGSMKTFFRGDADWFTSADGTFAFTTVGFGARLMTQEKGAEEPKDALVLKGTAKGLVAVDGSLVVVTANDDGSTTIRFKE